MPNPNNDSNWNIWSKYVLKTLEEIKSEISDIKDKMTCDVHKERMAGINTRIAWLWGIVSFIILAIVGMSCTVLAQ